MTAAVARMTGNFTKADMGEWKPGDKAMADYQANLQFYELLFDGQEKVHIDIPNMIRRIDGVDQLEAVRAALEI